MQIAGVEQEQLFLDLVNSEWYDGYGRREDRLADAVWRGELLAFWALGETGAPSRTEVGRLKGLRDTLRTIVEEAHAGRSPSVRPLEELASALPSIPMRLEFGDASADWTVRSSSWAYVEAEVIRSCVGFLRSPALGRLRRCDNEGCLWAFVDASRNGNRRWCDPAICGNVAKVRAYRQRQQVLVIQGGT